MRGGGGLAREKRGGRGGGGDGGIPDDLFDELKKKLPRPLPKVPVMQTCDAQGERSPNRPLCQKDIFQEF